jgi:hypothetical protein
MNESIIISDKVREQITARAGLVGIGIKTRRASVAPQPAWTLQHNPRFPGRKAGVVIVVIWVTAQALARYGSNRTRITQMLRIHADFLRFYPRKSD